MSNTTKNDEVMDDDFLGGASAQGFDNVGADDIKTPYLTILQKLSPQCDENKPEYLEKAKAGMFYNSLTKELYGKEVNVIVLRTKKLWMEYKPNRGPLVSRHEPNSIPVDQSNYSKWVTANGNEITEVMNFYVLIEGKEDEGVVIFSLSKTGLRHAKSWTSDMMMLRTDAGKPANMFAGIWKMRAELNENANGSWFTVGKGKTCSISFDKFITKDLFVEHVKGAYEFAKVLVEDSTTPRKPQMALTESTEEDY